MLFAGECALHGLPRRSGLTRRLAGYAAFALLLALWQPGDRPRVRLEPGERLLDLREGPCGVVAVVEEGGRRRMSLDNYYLLGGTASTGEERLQAHIPLLLHPDARRVAFLGLGTGITAGAALFHPVSQVTAMELVPEIVEAARRHFREANRGALEDQRVEIAVEDARTRLRASPGRFDVIVGDLVVPWRHGEAALYTVESFEAARRALAPGGIFCQWVPLFQLSRREFESIAASFVDVFPRSLLFKGDFRAGEPAVALVGLTSSEPLDPEAIDARARYLALLGDSSNPYLSDPAGLWVFLAGSLSPEDPALGAARRSRRHHPVVELMSAATNFATPGDAGAPFTGERLKGYFDALLERPVAGTPLERLDELHLRWRRAGAEIWAASLLDLQGRRAEADALGLGALAKLPERLQRAVRPEPAGSAAAPDARDTRPAPAPGVAPAEAETALVTKVIDGDTIEVVLRGRRERVRLLGIDAPEKRTKERPGEPFAKEATDFARDLTLGREVALTTDPGHEDRDGYGRLLRYVGLPDGRSLNLEMVCQGYARAYTRFRFTRQKEFRECEKEARARGRGLWSAPPF
jgi:endonuclease YncB( thermonuclease family)/spermidine synthase